MAALVVGTGGGSIYITPNESGPLITWCLNTVHPPPPRSFAGSGGGGFRLRAERTKSMKSVFPETSLPGIGEGFTLKIYTGLWGLTEGGVANKGPQGLGFNFVAKESVSYLAANFLSPLHNYLRAHQSLQLKTPLYASLRTLMKTAICLLFP